MYGQRKALSQFLGETLHLFRLDAFGPAHPQRVTHYDFGDFIVANHLLQLFEIEPFILPLDGFESLSSNTQRIRNSYSDPFGTYIQA